MAKTKTATKTSPKKRSTSATPKKAATTAKKSAKKKAPAKKKKAAKPEKTAGEMEATIDRRRPASMQNKEDADATPKLERRKKVNRRRQIDPTTCERDYSDAEVEFMGALDEYKRKNGRMFPTCSEVLEVIRSLGYVQLSPAEIAARTPAEAEATDDLEQQAEAEALGAQADSESLQVDAETELKSPVA